MAVRPGHAKLCGHFQIAPLRLIYQVKEGNFTQSPQNHSFSVNINLYENLIICILNLILKKFQETR